MNSKTDKKKILIVDDEIDIREFLKKGLQREGYQAVSAGSAVLGLRLLSRVNFDVLISDVNMPQIDGLEFVSRARRMQPQLAILLLTGYGTLDSAKEAIRIGVNDYLTKPVGMEKLRGAVANGLKRQAEIREGLEYYQGLEKEIKENEEEFNNMKSELITLISHEFRTPITVITSGLDLFKETMELPKDRNMQGLTDEQKKHLLDNVEQGSRRLVRIIEDMTCYMNLTKGKVKMNTVGVNLKEFFERNFETLAQFVSERKATLKKDFVGGEAISANICPEKMLDVLERIIRNAAYHNPEGAEITLRLTCANNLDKSGSQSGMANIEISDNGSGIDESLLKTLFNPFSSDDIDHHSKGMGMGLCISKKIVELHNGQIGIESIKGQGTKVTIELPTI